MAFPECPNASTGDQIAFPECPNALTGDRIAFPEPPKMLTKKEKPRRGGRPQAGVEPLHNRTPHQTEAPQGATERQHILHHSVTPSGVRVAEPSITHTHLLREGSLSGNSIARECFSPQISPRGLLSITQIWRTAQCCGSPICFMRFVLR